jgi:hypothetical protein
MPQSQITSKLVTSSEAFSPVQWRGPLFVIGVWRSGTSLLYALLNKHPQIALMYEGDLALLRPLFWITGRGSRWLGRWEFWNEALTRHAVDGSKIMRDVSDLQTAMKKAYVEYARQKEALIWGDKSPNYLDSLSRLSADFPEARFIVIWRDPAAICSSVIRAAEEEHSWFNRRGMTLRALMGYRVMRTECDWLVKHGARIHELRYEVMVRNPVDMMKEICEFLGIPFVPAMASLGGADRSAIYQGRHHSLVKEDRIVLSLERSEVLPAALRKKIARYVSLWRDETGNQWPFDSCLQNGGSEKPSLRERLFDRVLYRCLRAFDASVILTYCFVPLWLLKRFRAFEHKSEQTRPKGDFPDNGYS